MHYDPMIMAAVTRRSRPSSALLRTKRKPSVDLPDKRAKVKAARKANHRRSK